MRLDEFDAFKGEIKQLCASLGKAYSDALGQAYWRVLKDIPLEELEAHVERVLLTATAETKFPKPGQLRSTPAHRNPVSDPSMAKAEKESIVTWEEMRRDNPEKWLTAMSGKRAWEYAREYGISNIWFDLEQMCWRARA